MEGTIHTKKDAQEHGLIALPLASEINNEMIVYDCFITETGSLGKRYELEIQVPPEDMKKKAYTFSMYVGDFVMILKEKGLLPYKATLLQKGNALVLD